METEGDGGVQRRGCAGGGLVWAGTPLAPPLPQLVGAAAQQQQQQVRGVTGVPSLLPPLLFLSYYYPSSFPFSSPASYTSASYAACCCYLSLHFMLLRRPFFFCQHRTPCCVSIATEFPSIAKRSFPFPPHQQPSFQPHSYLLVPWLHSLHHTACHIPLHRTQPKKSWTGPPSPLQHHPFPACETRMRCQNTHFSRILVLFGDSER